MLVNIQESSSASEFKRYLTMNDKNVPNYYSNYYYLGKRTEQIIHCRLRVEMSDLNFDLFSRHLTDNPSCACGHPFETAEHFLLFCPNYQNECINTIRHLGNNYIEIHTLLFGDQSLGPLVNETVFENVQKYIRQTRRFCT